MKTLLLAAIIVFATKSTPVPAAGNEYCNTAGTSALQLANHAPVANPIAVDASLLTGVDISLSISPAEWRMQYAAIAAAITDPDILRTFQLGALGRIGFAVYTWSQPGETQIVVPWMVIGSESDAQAIAKILNSAPIYQRGALLVTDAGTAIRDGLDILSASTFISGRKVLNLLTNGFPSGDCDPAIMRNVAAEQDVTLNALIIGPKPNLAGYYRTEIVSGVGAFALEFSGLDDFSAAVSRKFMLDMATLMYWQFNEFP